MVEQREEWLQQTKRTIPFIERRCFDPADGRTWFHATREGASIRERRYAFSAAIAFAQYAHAIGSEQYAARVQNCFSASSSST
ncbi:N-acylglucosamine 2-epimerase [Blastopirellula marina DSM 3645]|uniref:N-acylglucosamine 2-epimerase n=1 Tax=Blastopirellula marina DSM 3645 TaxID=314230 RepID=A3ZVC9_9BACT|nr:N-acylglucosamine 2-epimerase [Blastopirellula marina DSM 3645]